METSKAWRLSGITSGVVLTIGLYFTPLHADNATAPNTPAASAPGDPFVKKDAPAPVEETGPVSNLILTVEVYHLSQADGSKLIQENDTDEARHDRILDLTKDGKARLDAVLCGAVKSGEQTVIEQVHVFRQAIAFDYLPGKGAVATDYRQPRSLGYRLVIKGQTSADKTGFNAMLFFEQTRLKGFLNQYSITGGYVPYTVALAQFDSRRVNAIPPFFPFEKIRFLGTYSPAPQDSVLPKPPLPNQPAEDSEMSLVFGKISQYQLDSGTPTDSKPAAFEQQFSLYSLDREKARQILSQKQEKDSAYQAVQALVKANQAKLEHLSILRTVSGKKGDLDEIAEATYPTGGIGQFETQDVGFSGEVKTDFIGHTSLLTIDVTKSQLLNYLENLPTEGIAASNNQSQPLFEVRNVVTQINTALGEHALLGTISPAGNTGVPGQKDTGRVWLEFLQTTAVNP